MQIKLTRTNVTVCKGVGGQLRGTLRAETYKGKKQ